MKMSFIKSRILVLFVLIAGTAVFGVPNVGFDDAAEYNGSFLRIILVDDQMAFSLEPSVPGIDLPAHNFNVSDLETALDAAVIDRGIKDEMVRMLTGSLKSEHKLRVFIETLEGILNSI